MSAHARTSQRIAVSIDDGERVEHHELDAMDARVSIGRDPRCTVPLSTAFASRQHVTADLGGNSMKVRDTSMNGTYVGGVLVKQHEVSVPFGTAIGIGPFTVVLERASVPSLLPVALPKPKPRLVTPPETPAVVTPAAPVARLVAAPTATSGSTEVARVDAWGEENAVRVEVHKRLLRRN